MRRIHVDLDRAVMDAYGWGDVELDYGFHTCRQMQRWTVNPAARVEILDRLLEENLRRAAAQGDTPPPADDDWNVSPGTPARIWNRLEADYRTDLERIRSQRELSVDVMWAKDFPVRELVSRVREPSEK